MHGGDSNLWNEEHLYIYIYHLYLYLYIKREIDCVLNTKLYAYH